MYVYLLTSCNIMMSSKNSGRRALVTPIGLSPLANIIIASQSIVKITKVCKIYIIYTRK